MYEKIVATPNLHEASVTHNSPEDTSKHQGDFNVEATSSGKLDGEQLNTVEIASSNQPPEVTTGQTNVDKLMIPVSLK